MGRADFLQLGDWNAICYQCGFKRKASTLERNWQGYYVCPEHNEPRQSQDFVRAIPDRQTVPWSQPDVAWVPIPAPTYTVTYTNAVVGFGDGTVYQLGSGLYPVTVTNVYLDGTPQVGWTTNSTGQITLASSPTHGNLITASGTEALPSPIGYITYTDAVIGHGDGVTTQFQLGSGTHTTVVTNVKVHGFGAFFWTTNSTGLITLAGIAGPGDVISASGVEFTA